MKCLTLQQASSARFYAIAFVLDGVGSVTYETGYNNSFSGILNTGRALTKPSADASCIWGLTTGFANTGYGSYSVSPSNDVTMVTSDASVYNGIRLVGVFDDGNGATTHTIRTEMSDNVGFAIDAVVLHEPTATLHYLIEDNSQLYTVSSGSLVTISGSLSAALFESDGFEDLTGVGALLETLTRPKLYAWNADKQPSVSASVTAIPFPQDIEKSVVLVGVTGVDEIVATYNGHPLVAVKVDSGAYVVYDAVNEEWVTATNGMELDDFQAIPSEAWEEFLNGASTVYVRIRLSATTDSLSELSIVFTTN